MQMTYLQAVAREGGRSRALIAASRSASDACLRNVKSKRPAGSAFWAARRADRDQSICFSETVVGSCPSEVSGRRTGDDRSAELVWLLKRLAPSDTAMDNNSPVTSFVGDGRTRVLHSASRDLLPCGGMAPCKEGKEASCDL